MGCNLSVCTFYWSILIYEDIRNNYNLPLEWREWFFDDIVPQFPAYYNSILIKNPQLIFMDITKDSETWNEDIKYQKSSSIADACNQFLLPNVICLWIWMEFIHEVGYVDLDTVIQQFIQKYNLYIVMYQNCLKYNTHAMTISGNLTMNMIRGYTILIVKYYQELLLWMYTFVF